MATFSRFNGEPERFSRGVGAEAWSHGRRATVRNAATPTHYAGRRTWATERRRRRHPTTRLRRTGWGAGSTRMAADVSGWRSARHNFRTTRVWDRTAVYIAGPAYWIAWVDTCAQEEAAATAENRTILEGAANTGAGVPDTLPEGAIVLFVDRRACASTMPKLLTHHYTEISCAKRRSGLARQVGKTARGNRRVMPHGANEPDIRTGAGRGRGI